MLSDIENLDIMLGGRHSERESVNSKSARRPESASSKTFENNEENLYLNHRELGTVMMPISDKILLVLTQTLSSTGCQVS